MRIYRTIPIYINRKCKIVDVLNFFLNNPPIKIDLSIPQNLTSYTNMINRSKELTLIEISQYEPIYSEVIIETGKTDNIVSLKEIHDKIMNIHIFSDIDSLRYINYLYSRVLNLINKSEPFMENLLEKVIAYEIIELYKRYFNITIDKVIYENEYIKVEPNTKYYVLFTRYIGDCELNNKLFGIFNKIFEINLLLSIFNSPLFMLSDYSIKSVSISGLSVSFNTPDFNFSGDGVINKLNNMKQHILENLADDLPERF